MQCVEEGRLNLDTAIRSRMTAVPDANATVRQVLAMASDAAAGSTYRYDGDRFLALTPVVEACTGVSYRVAVTRQILDRIGMADSVPGHDLESATENGIGRIRLADADALSGCAGANREALRRPRQPPDAE